MMNYSTVAGRAQLMGIGFRKTLKMAALALVLAVPGAVQAEEKEVGLTGLLPYELPEGLAEVKFAALPEEWNAWSEELKTSLSKLYGFEVLTLEQQEAQLVKLDGQLDKIYAALGNPAYADSHDLLVDLEGKLNRRLEVMYAVLKTLHDHPEKTEQLRPELQKLIQALEGYEADALEGRSAADVRAQLSKINELTNNQAELLGDTLRIHYFNFNIRTFVSEPFASYAFNECRRESGPVCDFILGARVRGRQHTNSGVSIKFIPSEDSACFSINIAGNTRSNTSGVTDQATVYTYGNHYFSGRKVMKYDGEKFAAYKATLGVNPNNTVLDAKLNRRGLIAKLIGDKIAYNKAVEMTPKTESIAASRIRTRVLPKFNSEVENTFGELNQEQEKLRARMAKESIAPNETLARTDKDELRVAERLMNDGQLGADRPSTVFNTKTGMTVQIHESWINNAEARETLDVYEPEMSFPDFGKMLSAKFERAFNRELEREDVEDDGDKVIIYDVDPMHVQFDAGRVKVILRIGLIQDGRDDVIKLRRVEIPLKLVVEDDVIRLRVSDEEDDKVRVLPLDPSDKRPIANRIMGDKIKTKFEERLADQTFDRHMIIKADENGGKTVPVTIASIHPVNGWLIVVIEPQAEPSEPKGKVEEIDVIEE